MLNKNIFKNDLLLSVQRALIGEISHSMRKIMVMWNKDKLEIRLHFIFEQNPSEDDLESVSLIETEIIADFFSDAEPWLVHSTTETTAGQINWNNYPDFTTVYARKEVSWVE